MGWASMTADGTGLLVFIDGVTARLAEDKLTKGTSQYKRFSQRKEMGYSLMAISVR